MRKRQKTLPGVTRRTLLSYSAASLALGATSRGTLAFKAARAYYMKRPGEMITA